MSKLLILHQVLWHILWCGLITAFVPPVYRSCAFQSSGTKSVQFQHTPSTRQARDKRWDQSYEELLHFYSAHGHTDVGKSNQTVSLNNFVQNQRKEFKKWRRGDKTTMDDHKIQLLNRLSFVWDKKQHIWEGRYAELLEFKREFGHVNVPMKYKTLGQWVTKHRKAKRAGALSQDRIDRLNEIGFVWDVKEWQFQTRLDQIKQFKAQHGHIDIKVTDGELGSWFYSRRKEYLKILNGENTTLTVPHRIALEEVGFGPHLGERRRNLLPSNSSSSWDARFQELVQFKIMFNHTRVPKIPRYAQLSTWVNHQRNLKATGKLARGRLLILESMGFVWNTNQWLWMKRYNELEAFQLKQGNTNVPKGHGDLGEWVDWQRVQFSNYEKGKRSSITAQRVTLLNNIGFDWNRGETRRIEWDLSWHRNLYQLKKWKEKYGNCTVPRHKDPALGLWVSHQRMSYKLSLRGEKTTLSDDRIAQLKEIGLLVDSEGSVNAGDTTNE